MRFEDASASIYKYICVCVCADFVVHFAIFFNSSFLSYFFFNFRFLSFFFATFDCYINLVLRASYYFLYIIQKESTHTRHFKNTFGFKTKIYIFFQSAMYTFYA